jgi:hypothetical protein
MKMPAVENALSASIDVGGIFFRALNNFSKFSGLFLVDSKRDISFLIILLLAGRLLLKSMQPQLFNALLGLPRV